MAEFGKSANRPGLESRYLGLGMVVNIAFTIPLAFTIGMLGVPVGTALGLIASTLYFLHIARREIDPGLRSFLQTFPALRSSSAWRSRLCSRYPRTSSPHGRGRARPLRRPGSHRPRCLHDRRRGVEANLAQCRRLGRPRRCRQRRWSRCAAGGRPQLERAATLGRSAVEEAGDRRAIVVSSAAETSGSACACMACGPASTPGDWRSLSTAARRSPAAVLRRL